MQRRTRPSPQAGAEAEGEPARRPPDGGAARFRQNAAPGSAARGGDPGLGLEQAGRAGWMTNGLHSIMTRHGLLARTSGRAADLSGPAGPAGLLRISTESVLSPTACQQAACGVIVVPSRTGRSPALRGKVDLPSAQLTDGRPLGAGLDSRRRRCAAPPCRRGGCTVEIDHAFVVQVAAADRGSHRARSASRHSNARGCHRCHSWLMRCFCQYAVRGSRGAPVRRSPPLPRTPRPAGRPRDSPRRSPRAAAIRSTVSRSRAFVTAWRRRPRALDLPCGQPEPAQFGTGANSAQTCTSATLSQPEFRPAGSLPEPGHAPGQMPPRFRLLRGDLPPGPAPLARNRAEHQRRNSSRPCRRLSIRMNRQRVTKSPTATTPG